MNPLRFLQVLMGAFGFAYLATWMRHGKPQAPGDAGPPRPSELAIGFGTNFFDTLGIGSYAPTTALFRWFGLVPDERIPGTMNVGHTLPVIIQGFVFTTLIRVEFVTLFTMIAVSVVGAWLGAGVVAHWPRRRIQVGMGVALVIASVIFSMMNLELLPGGGNALGLQGWRLAVGIAGNFVLGMLVPLGIGSYGPSLIMVALLGMDPKAAFPIMMGSAAFLMCAAAIRFIREGAYRQRPALGLAIGGVPAVLIAALIVKSLPIIAVRWLVAVVVLWTGATMLKSALSSRAAERAPSAT